MRKCVAVVCVVMLMAAGVHAGLFDPAIINPSFEDPELGAGAQSNDINDWFDAVGFTYTADDAGDTYPETLYGDNWAELGNNRWLYQQIGTYEENMDLGISFLAGQRSTKEFTSVYVTLLVGGDPALAADVNLQFDTENPLETQVGAVQIARSEAITPFATADMGISEQVVSFSTGTGYTVGAPLWIQINKSPDGGRALIDNVDVVFPLAPVLVGPTPNGYDRAPINADLEWSAPPVGIVDHYILNVRQGDPNFADAGTTVVDPATSPYEGLGTMPYATQYYWRVDVVNDSAETIIGKLWSFTTAPEVPQVDEQPEGVLVPGDGSADATFTLAGLNIVNYKWQKDGSPLSDVGNISGSSTAVLTVTGATLADEGLYSCVVDNNKGDADETTQALLMTERLVAHFAFDNDLTDSQGNLETGVVVDPNEADSLVPDVGYGTGLIGTGALELAANEGVEGYQPGFVAIPNSAGSANFFPLGITVSAWINTTVTGLGHAAVLDSRDDDASVNDVLLDHYNGGRGRFKTEGIGVINSPTDLPDMRDGQWHFITGSYDAVNGEQRLYIDGKFAISNNGTNDTTVFDTMATLRIGGQYLNAAGNIVRPFKGLIDDVKIYSYPLDAYTIANNYVEIMPEKAICVELAGLEVFDVTGPDGVSDCIIDMYDFAAFAAEWLNCNRVAGASSGLVNCK